MTRVLKSFPGVYLADIDEANRLFDKETHDFLPINGYTDTDYIIETPSGEDVLENERDKVRYVPVAVDSLQE